MFVGFGSGKNEEKGNRGSDPKDSRTHKGELQ